MDLQTDGNYYLLLKTMPFIDVYLAKFGIALLFFSYKDLSKHKFYWASSIESFETLEKFVSIFPNDYNDSSTY